MTLDEYIEQMRQRLEDFEKTYSAYMLDDPENWPANHPSSGDWDEQFDTLTEAPMTAKLTREAARKAYAESGLDFFPLTLERMAALRDNINSEMLAAGLMQGTYHMAHPSLIRFYGSNCADLRCESYHFDDREAVTFNADGSVGFAGWADDMYVQPILRGFLQWVEHEEELAELN